MGIVVHNIIRILLNNGYGIIIPGSYLFKDKVTIHSIVITPEVAIVFRTFIYFVFVMMAMILVASIKTVLKPTKDSVAMLGLASIQSALMMYCLDTVTPPELGLASYLPSCVLLVMAVMTYIEVHDAKIPVEAPS